MADYHRFVAYIYEYVNGKKMQNTGFAKIELRNAICRIQIHIQNIRMLDGKTEVFGIVRQPKESRKNNPIILLIGEGQTQGSGFDRSEDRSTSVLLGRCGDFLNVQMNEFPEGHVKVSSWGICSFCTSLASGTV